MCPAPRLAPRRPVSVHALACETSQPGVHVPSSSPCSSPPGQRPRACLRNVTTRSACAQLLALLLAARSASTHLPAKRHNQECMCPAPRLAPRRPVSVHALACETSQPGVHAVRSLLWCFFCSLDQYNFFYIFCANFSEI
jgi:hypothetical protein